jgi:hypothetical protein
MWRCAGVEGSPRFVTVWWETPVRITAIRVLYIWPVRHLTDTYPDTVRCRGRIREKSMAKGVYEPLSMISHYLTICIVTCFVLTLSSLIDGYRRFGRNYLLRIDMTGPQFPISVPFLLYPENWGSNFLRNAGPNMLDIMSSDSRRVSLHTHRSQLRGDR